MEWNRRLLSQWMESQVSIFFTITNENGFVGRIKKIDNSSVYFELLDGMTKKIELWKIKDIAIINIVEQYKRPTSVC